MVQSKQRLALENLMAGGKRIDTFTRHELSTISFNTTQKRLEHFVSQNVLAFLFILVCDLLFQ